MLRFDADIAKDKKSGFRGTAFYAFDAEVIHFFREERVNGKREENVKQYLVIQ